MTVASRSPSHSTARTYAEPDPGLQVLATWRVQSGALMLLGRAPDMVPASGEVQLALGPQGAFRALSWPMAPEEHGGHAFLMAVRLSNRADLPDDAVFTLRGVGGERLTLRPPAAVSDMARGAAFGQHVARLAGQHAVAVARFILDTLRPRADRDVAGMGAMLRAFLSQAAQPDGMIESIAAVPGGCVLLQGLGTRIEGAVQVILAGAALPCFAGHAGEFSRIDATEQVTGVLLALPPDAAGAMAGLDHVFILSDHGLHSRSLLGHRLLDPVASVGHIRHMLSNLRGLPPMRALLRAALQPRYDGQDTLRDNAHPVRATIDFAAAAPDVGAYLLGWVFDPTHLLAELHLCSTNGLMTRIDTVWTRLQRPDVTDSFRATPGFPPPSDANSGFAVSVAAAFAPSDALFLQFTFSDGNRAFLPVPAANPADPAVRRRLLASVDPSSPSGPMILERHVAPLMSRLRPAVHPPARVLVPGPTMREHAVVVPLAAPVLPRAFLSGFLQDPLGATEQLVLVCGPEWEQPALDVLHDVTRFYGLSATILASLHTAWPATALREAARCTAASVFLLAGPGVSGRALGWRPALYMAVTGPEGAAFACPTLLYEDWSIRYAGSADLGFQDFAPCAPLHSLVAGTPAARAADPAPVAAATGTLDCCAVRRPSLAALDGAGVLLTNAGREADFFMRLSAAGLAGVWLPSVQVYAPEDAAEEQSQAGRLVDGWLLRESWRLPSPQAVGRE